MNGIELITVERQRQIDVEGWTSEHDAEHDDHELIRAAVVYVLSVANKNKPTIHTIPAMTFWPHQWNEDWFKPTWHDPIRMLTKAGALIAAEIDRLQRMDNGLPTHSSPATPAVPS